VDWRILLMDYTPPVVQAQSYDEAMRHFAALQGLDDDAVNPLCRSQLLTHGAMAERVVVLLHGMTNCPQQYVQFAPLLFERGCNVLIPRMPGNGLLDRNTRALGRLTVEASARSATETLHIAVGLGRRVVVAGISAGGVVAGWLGQFQRGVDAAVLIAPSFGIVPPLRVANDAVNHLATQILSILPNVMTQRFKPFTEGPPQGYYGFATRGLAAMLRMGDAVQRAARTTAPACQRFALVLNAADPAVNNPLTLHIAERWQAHGATVTNYAFSADHHYIHDIIDPQQPQQHVAETYPVLLDQIMGA
jgi:hypothetical protein